jgi:hypothetical protein
MEGIAVSGIVLFGIIFRIAAKREEAGCSREGTNSDGGISFYINFQNV